MSEIGRMSKRESMANFSSDRSKVAEHAIKMYKKKINTYLRNSLQAWAKNICKAAVDNREHAVGAHNYTGNLIGSIVAAVYENGELIKAHSATEFTHRDPIRREMTAGGGHHGVYHFPEDYDFWQNTNYVPEVDTDEAMAIEHINDFLVDYRPHSQYFEIVVAYTSCYAGFVEKERHTTGFDKTLKNFNSLALRFTENTAKGWNFLQVSMN